MAAAGLGILSWRAAALPVSRAGYCPRETAPCRELAIGAPSGGGRPILSQLQLA